MAESAGLENRYRGNSIEGSNPSLSAILYLTVLIPREKRGAPASCGTCLRHDGAPNCRRRPLAAGHSRAVTCPNSENEAGPIGRSSDGSVVFAGIPHGEQSRLTVRALLARGPHRSLWSLALRMGAKRFAAAFGRWAHDAPICAQMVRAVLETIGRSCDGPRVVAGIPPANNVRPALSAAPSQVPMPIGMDQRCETEKQRELLGGVEQ